MSIAYALREDFKGTVEVFDTVEDQQAGNGREQRRYLGGLIAVADERDFDPLAELTIAGNGDADAGIIVEIGRASGGARRGAPHAAIAGGDQETAADPNPEQAGDGQEA
jgi:hypothetical protein